MVEVVVVDVVVTVVVIVVAVTVSGKIFNIMGFYEWCSLYIGKRLVTCQGLQPEWKTLKQIIRLQSRRVSVDFSVDTRIQFLCVLI